MVKGIHLAPEVKTSVDNSTHATGSSMEPVLRNLEFPLRAIIDITGKKRRRTYIQKGTKQSLSNYAQQDLSMVT
jgi:hypothetical protein